MGAPGVEVASHFTLQEMSRPGAAGSERILLDILEHDWREAQDSRQELCQKLHAVQGELQWAEELRDKVGPMPASPPPSDPPTSTKGPGLGLWGETARHGGNTQQPATGALSRPWAHSSPLINPCVSGGPV